VSAQLHQRRRPATSATSQAIFPASARNQDSKGKVDSNRVAAEPSATNVARSDTLPATATKVASNKVEDSNREEVETFVKVDKPATLAVVTDTCPGTAPKDRSATTADRSAILAVSAQVSKTVFATSASNPDTSSLSAQSLTRLLSSCDWRYGLLM